MKCEEQNGNKVQQCKILESGEHLDVNKGPNVKQLRCGQSVTAVLGGLH